MSNETGSLHVVATPIGNLGDMSSRAVETLRAVTVIAAEDTRHARRLLNHFGIATPAVSYHEHNEQARAAELVGRLRAGDDVALISDAGTPLLSDPGYRLVRAAREAGIEVLAVPGPAALVAALSIAGLPTNRFAFEGFPPTQKAKRRARFAELAPEPRTLVFYESVHRLGDALADMREAFGAARGAVVARELTKRHETVYHGDLDSVLDQVVGDPDAVRGEVVVVVEGAPAVAPGDDGDISMAVDDLLGALLRELPVKKAAAVAAELTGRRKNDLYRRALGLLDTSRE